MDEHFPAGIDEAGRGCLIGPMFMVCLVIKNYTVFEKIELSDSKKYGSSDKARKIRSQLHSRIASCCSIYSIETPAHVIDREIIEGDGLNALERKCASHLLSTGSSGVPTIADGINIFRQLSTIFPNLAVENKADEKFRAVMAASICAKHMRDQWVENYFKQMESVVGYRAEGGGYVNKKTLKFVEDFLKITGSKPPQLRESWKLK